MQLPLQNFSTLVSNAAAAVQGAAAQLLDLSVGSALRAVLEASASVSLWLQWLIVLVLQTTRAATSTGPDLDTWMADFSVTRLPASTAAGEVQFSRFAPTASALVPVGTPVTTADGTQTFAVVADPTNAAWQASLNGYLLAAGVASVSVPVQALVAGSAGDVQAGSITLIGAAVSGIDTVANAAPMAGGLDAESDAALRARFQLYLESLSRATPLAIGSAVLASRQGLAYSISENVTPGGAPMMGSFVVTVDDGSGYPPGSVLTGAANAIEAVRPVGTTFAVQPPNVQSVAVSLGVTTVASYDPAAVAAAVTSAITSFIDALPIGATLPYTRLLQVAYDASPGVANATGLLVANGVADISAGPSGVIKAASVTVS
jgi:uncharacterized phage protein gp47/JayE